MDLENELIVVFEQIVETMKTAEKNLVSGYHRKNWVMDTLEYILTQKYDQNWWFEHQLIISALIDFIILIDSGDVLLEIQKVKQCISRMC